MKNLPWWVYVIMFPPGLFVMAALIGWFVDNLPIMTQGALR